MSVLQSPGEVDPLVGVAAGPPAPEESEQVLRRRYVLRSLRRSPTFLVGVAILLFWVFMALFSVHVTRYGPLAIDPLHPFAHPSAATGSAPTKPDATCCLAPWPAPAPCSSSPPS